MAVGRGRTGRFIIVAAAVVLGCGTAAPASPAPGPSTSAVVADEFSRPHADVIRRETADILKDPRFAARPSLWMGVCNWLMERLRRLHLSAPNLPPGLAKVLYWGLIIWCVLTLLAILAHLAWTIWVGVRSWRLRGGDLSVRRVGPLRGALSADELRSALDDAVRRGRYSEAIRMTLLLLLAVLEGRGLLQRHESKTNGDYVREYPPDRRGGPEFRRFIRAFDGAIYGQSEPGRETFLALDRLCQDVCQHDGEKPQD